MQVACRWDDLTKAPKGCSVKIFRGKRARNARLYSWLVYEEEIQRKKVSNSSFEILTFLQNSQSMSSACEFWREGSILYIICYIKQELDLFTMHPFESAKKMGAGCSDENGGWWECPWSTKCPPTNPGRLNIVTKCNECIILLPYLVVVDSPRQRKRKWENLTKIVPLVFSSSIAQLPFALQLARPMYGRWGGHCCG